MKSSLKKAADGLKRAFNQATEKALDQIERKDPVKTGGRVETLEDGRVYAVLEIGEFRKTERIPREVLEWPADRQSEYLDQVLDRLAKKMRMYEKDEQAKIEQNLDRDIKRSENRRERNKMARERMKQSVRARARRGRGG